MFRAQTVELERSNQWAEALNRELEERRARVAELQAELARDQENARKVAEGYAAKVAELERDNDEQAAWAKDSEARLGAAVKDLELAVAALHQAEKDLEERTAWALRLQEEGRQLADRLAMYHASRWVKLGRTIGLGPSSGGPA